MHEDLSPKVWGEGKPLSAEWVMLFVCIGYHSVQISDLNTSNLSLKKGAQCLHYLPLTLALNLIGACEGATEKRMLIILSSPELQSGSWGLK